MSSHHDKLLESAANNVAHGLIDEPRVYFDQVTLTSTSTANPFTNQVFRNGEEFTVRITHAVFAIRPDFDVSPPVGVDERLVQLVGVRMRFHDTYYQNEAFLPVPLWANKVVAASEASTRGSAHWILDRPFVLSSRDAMRVQFQPEPNANLGTRRFGVGFSGVGLSSRKPYLIASSRTVATTALVQLDPLEYKNDGVEPIAVTDVTFTATGDIDASSPAGDIRTVAFQIQGLGNGTQRPWFIGPFASALCPGHLLGITTGRSVVHRFPGDGIIWDPGEGVTVEAIALSNTVLNRRFLVALVGYITVK